MNWRVIISVFLGLLAGLPVHTRAQENVPESFAYLLLSDPTGIRTVGMGTSGVADNGDPSNIFFNPANVVSAPRVYLRWAHWDWSSVEKETAVSGGGSWRNTIGGRSFEFGADLTVGLLDLTGEYRTIYLPEGNGQSLPSENFVALSGGAGTMSGGRWDARLGVAAKRYWQEDDGRDGYGFDVGTTVACHATASGWDITPAAALAFVNLGPPLEETDRYRYRLPARFHYGFSVHVESPRVEVNKTQVPLVAITCNLDGTDPFYGLPSQWSFGSEFALAQILFLRAGTMFREGQGFLDSSVSYQSAVGAGIGYPVYSALLRFDYAKLPAFPDPHRYQLYLEF